MQSRHRGRRFLREDVQRSMWQRSAKYVFHRNGMPIRDPRRSWAAACKAAGLVKPKLGKNGEPVTEIISGSNGGRGIRSFSVLVPSVTYRKHDRLVEAERVKRHRPGTRQARCYNLSIPKNTCPHYKATKSSNMNCKKLCKKLSASTGCFCRSFGS
jgi:hypothetical protein